MLMMNFKRVCNNIYKINNIEATSYFYFVSYAFWVIETDLLVVTDNGFSNITMVYINVQYIQLTFWLIPAFPKRCIFKIMPKNKLFS